MRRFCCSRGVVGVLFVEAVPDVADVLLLLALGLAVGVLLVQVDRADFRFLRLLIILVLIIV